VQDNGAKDQTTRRIEFSEEAYEALEALAQERGVSIAEVLRDALSHEQWIEELRKDKGRILVERNGEQRELVLG
jgi:hypothetical protein